MYNSAQEIWCTEGFWEIYRKTKIRVSKSARYRTRQNFKHVAQKIAMIIVYTAASQLEHINRVPHSFYRWLCGFLRGFLVN
jgi:hypothetical protein